MSRELNVGDRVKVINIPKRGVRCGLVKDIGEGQAISDRDINYRVHNNARGTVVGFLEQTSHYIVEFDRVISEFDGVTLEKASVAVASNRVNNLVVKINILEQLAEI